MDVTVVDVVQRVVVCTEPHIALIIKPYFGGVEVLDQYPPPDVKFLTLKCHGVLYILLYHKLHIPSQAIVRNIIQVVEASDSSTSRHN